MNVVSIMLFYLIIIFLSLWLYLNGFKNKMIFSNQKGYKF